MSKKVSHKTLMNRSKANDNALGQQFTVMGMGALLNVVNERISPDKAFESLFLMRDLLLDKKGDLINKEQARQRLAKAGIMGVNLEYLA